LNCPGRTATLGRGLRDCVGERCASQRRGPERGSVSRSIVRSSTRSNSFQGGLAGGAAATGFQHSRGPTERGCVAEQPQQCANIKMHQISPTEWHEPVRKLIGFETEQEGNMAKLKTIHGTKGHKVVSQKERLTARKRLLAKEKKFSRLRDQLNQQRRDLPWVKVEKEYVF